MHSPKAAAEMHKKCTKPTNKVISEKNALFSLSIDELK